MAAEIQKQMHPQQILRQNPQQKLQAKLPVKAASEASSEAGSEAADAGAAMEGFINVISREDGSGTRSAFVELMGIEQEDENGEKVDMTLPEAQISKQHIRCYDNCFRRMFPQSDISPLVP